MDYQSGFRFNKDVYALTKLIDEGDGISAAKITVQQGDEIITLEAGSAGGYVKDLIWENPDPTAALAANVQITDDYTMYPFWCVEYLNTTGGSAINNVIYDSETIAHGAKTISSEAGGNTWNRKMYKSGTKLFISGHCYIMPGDQDDQTKSLPVKVYGIKRG